MLEAIPVVLPPNGNGYALELPVTREEVLEQMERMAESSMFKNAPRMRRFLEYTIRHAIAGNSGALKEYSIGVEVFGKPDTFDPRLDSIVRVEARRLRSKVLAYYRTHPNSGELVIAYKRGDYMPTFKRHAADGDHEDDATLLCIMSAGNGIGKRLLNDLATLGYQLADGRPLAAGELDAVRDAEVVRVSPAQPVAG